MRDDHTIISCRNGHRLRVPTTEGTLNVICPTCHVRFEWTPRPPIVIEIPSKPRWTDRAKRILPGPASPLRKWATGLAILVCAIIVLFVIPGLIDKFNTPSLPSSYVPAKPIFDGTRQPLPDTGAVWLYYQGGGGRRLQVETQSGDGHHLIKIEDWKSGRAVALLFIREGDKQKVNVPPGTYRIKFACGRTWYGDKLRFGPGESCFVADEPFDFDDRGWSITLYPVTDGNLQKTRIPGDEF